MQDFDLSEVNIDEVDDLNEISINRRESKEQRIMDSIRKTKNLNIFKLNSRLVKIEFNDNGMKEEDLLLML